MTCSMVNRTVDPDEDRIGQDRIGQIRLGEDRTEEPCANQHDLSDSIRECFIHSFGREPDIQFVRTVSKMLKTGLSEEEILYHITDSVSRSPRSPEAYIISKLKGLVQMRDNPDNLQGKPLGEWELDWLERFRRYQEEQKKRQEVSSCEKEEN